MKFLSFILNSDLIYFFFLQKKAVGSDLYEQVFYSLDLIEKDYFGLQFTDANHVQVTKYIFLFIFICFFNNIFYILKKMTVFY